MSELEPTRTCSNPTATEVLRRLLDKRGVEWQAPTSFDGTARYDTVAGGYWFHEYDGKITIHGLDPEQAIAATLGTGTCHEIEDEDTGFIVCSECGAVHDESYTAYYCWCCGRRIEQ